MKFWNGESSVLLWDFGGAIALLVPRKLCLCLAQKNVILVGVKTFQNVIKLTLQELKQMILKESYWE